MKNIKAEELKKDIDKSENITLIDVRSQQELVRGKIPGSVNIPLEVLEEVLDKKIINKDEKVYLYCLSGSRSEVAAQIMDNLGYRYVYNLEHGLLEWRIRGYTLVN